MTQILRKHYALAFPALLAAAFGLAASPAVAQGETRIASWNLKRLGHGEDRDFEAVAAVAAQFDLLALQEVMTSDGAERLLDALEAETGADWEMILSHAIGRGSYKEMYAFVWREDRIEWSSGAAVYIDDRDAFAREPLSARFETEGGWGFVMTSIHLIYGDSVEERQAEVAALAGFRDWLEAEFPKDPVILAGDFNLPPSDPAWAAVGARSWPMIQDGATTLGRRRRFVSLYDNI